MNQLVAGPLVLGKYVLLARLATGGMAEILLARRRGAAGFEKLVVIKRLLPHLADDRHWVSMFLDEARICARISHQNVCQVHELEEEGGTYYIVMEYLEGVALSRVIHRLKGGQGAVDLRLLAGLVQQACEGLHHAHELANADGTPVGLVHRDISPGNLFVTLDGVVKVLDFGIAKTRESSVKTRTGTVKGKTAYMSPEQIRGEPLDRRSDVFSLGVVLYEAVTGHVLFRRENDFLTFRAITEEKVLDLRTLRPDLPEALARIIGATIAKPREDRPATARAVGDAVCEAIAPLGRPWSQVAIADWMLAQFGAELRGRRERVADVIARASRPAAEPYAPTEHHTDTSQLPEVPTDATLQDEDSSPGSLPTETPSSVTRDSELDRTLPPPLLTTPTNLRPVRAGTLRSLLLLGGGLIVGAGVGFIAWRRSDIPVATTTPAPAAEPVPAPGSEPVPDPVPVPVPDPAAAPPTTPTPTTPTRTPTRHPTPPRPAPSRAPGSLTIDSKPYATIYIDGKKVGVTPLLRLPLDPGAHAVRAVTSDGRVQRFRIVIEAGKEAPRRRLVW